MKKELLIKMIEQNQSVQDVMYEFIELAIRDRCSKGDLMKFALDKTNNIDVAMPLGFSDDMAEWNIRPFPYVMDYRDSKFGKPLNLYESIVDKLFKTVKEAEL